MAKKQNVSSDVKLKAVNEYLAGNGSLYYISGKYGVSRDTFRYWLGKYKALGNGAFTKSRHNTIVNKRVLYFN